MSNSADMMMRCPACNTGFFDAIAYQVHQANCRAAMSCPSCAAKDAEIERLEDEVAKLYEQRIAMFDKINEIKRILRGEG